MKLNINPGDRFNSFTIIEEVPKTGTRRRFKCKCDCGNVVDVDLNNLTSNHTKSCGKCDYKPIHIGDKFGHWTVIGDYIQENGFHKNYLCECDCEKKTQRYVDEQNLKRGLSISCGCVTSKCNKERMTKHGDSGTRLFIIWVSMKDRCLNPGNTRYHDYGGRGVSVCDEWLNDYATFKEWAVSHGYRDDLTIDRIDVNGNYCPENCRWATHIEQCNNKRNNVKITYEGETHTVMEWSRITGINRQTLMQRFRNGYTLEDVFFNGKFPTRRKL